MKKTRVIVNCSNCGAEIERKLSQVKSRKDHYCNRKCRTEWCKANWHGKDSPAYRGGPVKMNCAWCDKGIEIPLSVSKNGKYHFCNAECKRKWQSSEKNPARNRIEVNCTQCGKPLSKTPAQLKKCPKPFCDRKCFTDWRRENWQDGKAPQWRGQPGLVEVSCEICSKKVRRYPSYTKDHEHVFCSQKCRGVWMSQTNSGVNHHMWKGGPGIVNCEECGNPIVRPRFDIDTRSEKFFCGVKCRGKWQSKNMIGANHPGYKGNYLETECSHCGKPLEIENWRRDRAKKFFCDYECMGKWQAENLTGDTRYNWKGGEPNCYGPGWSHLREAVRERDSHQCQYCGMTNEDHLEEFGQALHVHHMKPFKEFGYIPGENENYQQANSLDNLITLCIVHHKKAEVGKIILNLVDHS